MMPDMKLTIELSLPVDTLGRDFALFLVSVRVALKRLLPGAHLKVGLPPCQ